MSRNYIILIIIFLALLFFLLIRSNTKLGNHDTPISPSSTTAGDFLNWKEFVWKDGNFKVMLPMSPHHVTDKLKDPKTNELRVYDTFVSADPLGQGYMVSIITFPKTIEEENVDLTLNNMVADTIARSKENKLNSVKNGKLKNYKAIDFSYNNSNRVIHGKVFAIKNTVYLLGVIDNNPTEDTKELDFFMNSFDTLTEK